MSIPTVEDKQELLCDLLGSGIFPWTYSAQTSGQFPFPFTWRRTFPPPPPSANLQYKEIYRYHVQN